MSLKNIFRKKKPNVILILMDGIRADAIDGAGYYKSLKKEGVFFSNVITYAPYTIASMHALFSGLYGNVNGVNGYHKLYSFDKDNCFTLTQYLKKEGYYAEADIIEENVVPAQGFDKLRMYGRGEIDLKKRHLEILNQIGLKQPFFLFLDFEHILPLMLKDVIKGRSDLDQSYFNEKERNIESYKQFVNLSTDYLSSIISKLKELDLYDNSLILIFSDHGCSVGDKFGEKLYGVYLYDYTLRCFLYIIGKGIGKSAEVQSQVRNVDILPSILEILKIKPVKDKTPIYGKSFLPIIKGSKEERIAYFETGGLGGPTPSPNEHNVQGVRTDKWKLIYNQSNGKRELYDLVNDKNEENNLAGKGLEAEEILWEKMTELSRQLNSKLK